MSDLHGRYRDFQDGNLTIRVQSFVPGVLDYQIYERRYPKKGSLPQHVLLTHFKVSCSDTISDMKVIAGYLPEVTK